MPSPVALYAGDLLATYGFPEGHPLGVNRQAAFLAEAIKQGLDRRVVLPAARLATRAEIERFHDPAHYDWVKTRAAIGKGYLDYGDTPAFPRALEAGAAVVGAALDGLARVMAGDALRTFQPIGGLHHARRGNCAGFCVFNDLGVVIDTLRAHYGVQRIAYIDIDVHHGDGVFYTYESDPDLIVVDVHEDGRLLYPGTGHAHETGRGAAEGTKLNLPMQPGAGDEDFYAAWARGVEHVRRHKPEFILMQCGADAMAGDPLADLAYTPAAYARAARDTRKLAEDFCGGRMMAFGGGGYDTRNLALAWSAVLTELAS